MKPITFPRTFQIWRYVVSHGTLLLRSTKGDAHKTQVDVLFKNVVYMQLPARFKGLTISEIASDDPRAATIPLGEFSPMGQTFFLVEGEGWSGFVVASVMSFLEEDASHSDTGKLLSGFMPEGW